ncbi:MAG: hypothetical protein ORO03_08750, partial [Alphaproteobacteria bacterium]|nr:hypothetical protein [Alphaproteobacteria bacterium]
MTPPARSDERIFYTLFLKKFAMIPSPRGFAPRQRRMSAKAVAVSLRSSPKIFYDFATQYVSVLNTLFDRLAVTIV